MNITILGAGAWGTALAKLLHAGGHAITLWGHEPDYLDQMRQTGRNDVFLPGIDLPRDWHYEPEARRGVARADLVVAAVPSKPFREVTECLADYAGIVVTVTKGIEYDTGLTMSGVLAQTAPRARVVALSGPTLALEVARGIPTAIVAAGDDSEATTVVQDLFHRPTFRVYTRLDRLGVELGGALKNVMAIAAGVCDGLGFGDNSKAALLTRSIAEMRRLGTACGAQAETFSGLSGLGDLTVTCFSRLSRNRGFGERLGSGEKVSEILAAMVSVAEGYPTARAAIRLARKLEISTPIIDQVYSMLYENKDVRQAFHDVTCRDSKAED
jgi:glycerol-3-phosphate dehydrogenase (NAD(P)+)